MSRCSKCGGNLVPSSETCIACGKPNPAFRPKIVQYSDPIDITPVNGRPRNFRRHIDPKIRIVTPAGGRVAF
jgi:hypothetical protein